MKKQLIVLLIVFMSPHLRSEIAFTQIKGLYKQLPDDKKHLSPVHGFNWWKTGIIENFWKFGDETTNTVSLIKEIFYLQPDNITFDITTLPRKAANYFTPQTFGKIISLIAPYTQPLSDDQQTALKKQLYTAISTDINFDQLVTNAQETLIADRAQLQKIKELVKRQVTLNVVLVRNQKRLATLRAAKEESDKTREQIETAQRAILQARQELAQIEPQIAPRKQIEKRIHNNDLTQKRLEDVVDYIVGSLQETFENKYVLYTTHIILLAALWKIATDKTDFLTYFHEIDPSLAIDETVFKHEEYTRDEFETFKKAIMHNPSLIMKNYELSSFYAFARQAWSSPLLPLIISSISNARYMHADDTLLFADCGETSLRNFFNILIYDPIKGSFDFKLLVQTALRNKLILYPSLAHYYAQYNQIAYIQTQAYYDGWVPVVSNLPGIEYNQIENYEISPGLSNMLNTFNVLLFGNNADYQSKSNSQKLNFLVGKVSRPQFSLTWRAQKGEFFKEDEAAPPVTTTSTHGPQQEVNIDYYNTGINIVFTVNNRDEFVWKFDDDHFAIENPEKQTSSVDTQLSMLLAQSINSSTQAFIANNLIGWFTHADHIQHIFSIISDPIERIFVLMTLSLKDPGTLKLLWPLLLTTEFPIPIIKNLVKSYPIQLLEYGDALASTIITTQATSLYSLIPKITFGGTTIAVMAQSNNPQWYSLIKNNLAYAYQKWDTIADHDSYIEAFELPQLNAIPEVSKLLGQFKDLVTLEHAIDTIEQENEQEYEIASKQVIDLLNAPHENHRKPLENVAAAILHMDESSDILDDLLRAIITETKNPNIIYHVLEHHTERFYPTTHPYILTIPSLHRYALNLIDEHDDLSFETVAQLVNTLTDYTLLERIAEKIRTKQLEKFYPLADEIQERLTTTGKERDESGGAAATTTTTTTTSFLPDLFNSAIQFVQNLFGSITTKSTLKS